MKSNHILILSNDSDEAARLADALGQNKDRFQVVPMPASVSRLLGHLSGNPASLAIVDCEEVSPEILSELCIVFRRHGLPFLAVPPRSRNALQGPGRLREIDEATSTRIGLLHRQSEAWEVSMAIQSALDRAEENTQKARRISQLTSTMACLAEALIVTDRDGRITLLNHAAEKITGWTQQEVLQKNCAQVLVWKQADTENPAECPVWKALSERSPAFRGRARLRTRSGHSVFLDYHGALIWEEMGSLLGSTVLLRPALAPEELGRGHPSGQGVSVDSVYSSPRQPDQEMADLDTFTYSIAHDLRAPLRAIHGFSSLLKQSSPFALDSENQEFLNAIGSNAVRMDRMIDEYLRLAKVSAEPISKTAVDMNELVHTVWDDIGKTRSEPMPELQVSNLPGVQGEKGLLQQVWFNLISNAVKFSSKSARPRIEIGSDAREGMISYWIRDNGIGFNPTQAARLFLPFRRLHDPADFPGEGVGLSLVHRILRKHGGTIQAHGVEGQGALFRIFLPCPEPSRLLPPEAVPAEGHHAE